MNAVLLTLALLNINPAPTSVRVKMDDQPVAWLYIAAKHKKIKSNSLSEISTVFNTKSPKWAIK